MEYIEFREELLKDIYISAEAEMSSIGTEFVKIIGTYLSEAEEFDDFTECYFEGTGRRNKKILLEGFEYNELDKTYSLVNCYFKGSNDIKTITQSVINNLSEKLRTFVISSFDGYIEENYEESTTEYGLAIDISARIEKISKFKFYIFSDQLLSSRVKFLKVDDIFNIPVELNVWDINRIYELSKSKRGKESIVVDFEKYMEKGIPYVKAGLKNTDDYEAYLAIIPGNILADIYIEYGSRLLEGNVRSFLSTRGKVNKNIRNTIKNNPEMFFAYNNGIAATASDVVMCSNSEGNYIAQIKDLQIINGGQTTASIANAVLQDKSDISSVFVPMKLSIVSNDKAEEIIPTISRCANSQNKVSEADFFSNHPFHIRVEELSRKLSAPAVNGNQYHTVWFYERARGQHVQAQMKLTRTEKNKYLLKYPKSQIIKKVDLAKYINVYLGKPHIVSKGSQYNMRSFAEMIDEEWKKSNVKFNNVYYKKAVALAIIFKSTEKLVSSTMWYQEIKSYRANIVAYTLAALFFNIKNRYEEKDFDFKRIWINQSLYDELIEQLIISTKIVFNELTSDERLTLNVTEWCKKEVCWTRVKELDIGLTKLFVDSLINKEDNLDEMKEAVKDQKQLNEINNETYVVEKGSEFWEKLLLWGIENKLLSPMEIDILKIAANFEKTYKIPSARQSKKIITMLEKMQKEGYNVN